MSRRTLLILVGIAVTLLAVLMLDRTGDRTPTGTDTLLLPHLFEEAGRVSVVRVTLPGDRVLVTLEQRGGEWVVAERDDWPADAAVLRRLVLALAQARRIEEMTSNPASYPRLGLQDIANPDAGGVAVTLEHNGERDRVIVGTTGVLDGGYSYARLADDATGWTVDRDLDVPRTVHGWLRRELMDLPAADVARVDILHADGERVGISRGAAGDDGFVIENVPDGREPVYDTVGAAIGGALANLELQDLADGEPPEDAVEAVFLTVDGRRVAVRAWHDGDRPLATFSAAVDRERVEARLRSQLPAQDTGARDGPPSPADDDTALDADTLHRALAEVAADVEALNARVEHRVFELPQHRHRQFTRRMAELLADEEQ